MIADKEILSSVVPNAAGSSKPKYGEQICGESVLLCPRRGTKERIKKRGKGKSMNVKKKVEDVVKLWDQIRRAVSNASE